MIDVEVLRGSQVRDQRGRLGRIVSITVPRVKLSWIKPNSMLTTEELLDRADPRVWNEIDILTFDRGWIPMGSILGARPHGRVEEFVSRLRGAVKQADEDDDETSEGSELPDKVPTVISYRRDPDDPFKKKLFQSRLEASKFVDRLQDEDYDEIRWWSEDMEEDWEVDLAGMWDCLAESCTACEGLTLEWIQEQRLLSEAKAKRRKPKGDAPSKTGSHNPFKRKTKLGPGPRGGRNKKTDTWVCWGTGPYAQKCYNQRSGYTKNVNINRAWKAAYNAEYKVWRASKRGRFRDAARKGIERSKARKAEKS